MISFLQEIEKQLVQQSGDDGGEKWEGYVDWKGQPARRGRHGGFLSASFVLGRYSII